MPQETSRSTTPTKRMNAVIQSQPEGLSYRLRHASPPRTPPRRRKEPPSSYPKSAKLAAATGAPIFHDDFHGYDRDSTTDDDVEDPHDLTYSSKHFPRASMVDNMVLALDQFSHPLADSTRGYYGEETRAYRGRGHTFSSSVSSENDIRTLQTQPATTPSQRPMRQSSARYARDPAKLPSIFGEDEDSTRVRVYEAQRAAPPKRTHKKRSSDGNTASAGAGGSGSTSSIDLSHLMLLQGRLGPAGNRRSQSFDFGSRRRNDDDSTNDTAPHPVVYSGPKAQKAPMSPPLPPATLERRGSTRSARPVRNKSSTLGTAAVQGTAASAVPPASAATPTGKKWTLSSDPAPAPRSGLLRLFFGSSRNPSPSQPPTSAPSHSHKDSTFTPPSVSKLQKQSHKDSVDFNNKENIQPTLTKKPSSFFRRRKKSVSNTVAPPLPLTLNTTLAQVETQPGLVSPVSSLKAFMDPYLADEKTAQASKSPTSPFRSFYTPGQSSADTGISRTESPEPIQQPKRGDRLTVPQKETFLTDSSSCEGDAEHSQTSDAEPGESQRSATRRTASTMPAATPSIRPVVEARSSSWHSDRLSVPPRKESLLTIDTSRQPPSQSKPRQYATQHRNTSGSDVSEYRSVPSTPAVTNGAGPASVSSVSSPRLHVSHPSMAQGPTIAQLDKAQHIYNNGEEEVDGDTAAAWLGEAGSDRERIRQAYMDLYDWTGHTILAALRSLCSRLVLKAESQLIDRILDAFARRWCSCNPNHGFKSADVVHTICYSILLLNTDLHMADIGSKMTRSQFVKNSMQTIRPVAADETNPSANQLLTVRSNSYAQGGSERSSMERDSSRAASSLGHRPTDQLSRTDSSGYGDGVNGPLVEAPFSGSQAGWELQIEGVLKDFYYSIQREPLPLFGSEPTAHRYPPHAASSNNLLGLGSLRRTPSVLSKAQSESNRSRYGDSKSLGSKWHSKGRSRPRLGSTPGFGSSINSLEDQSSAWSPSMSSMWSKASLGKTLTSMSVDSLATTGAMGHDYQSSIGFANALSQAIIRDDQIDTATEDGMKAAPLLDDESLELEGAPWAKEGILKHKCHLDGVDKRSKDRNWNDCFAVIEKGWMRLFSFSVTAKSLRNKARTQRPGNVVGGGNWQENAEEVWKFMLRHTIASSLPPPGYSKARPHVWALSLPTGAVHLFSVGTPDIVKEFVSTANYWSARLSKEPMIGGITSMEYGWSDTVINRALTGPEVRPSFASSEIQRPSTQMSIRSSLDQGTGAKPRLPGDKIHISDWSPPTQSLLASQLMEVDQLKALQTYVQNVEEDLQKHNELRSPMILAFSPKHSNYHKALGNWEKKSSYLLREIVKFKNYIDALQAAQQTKERIYKARQQEEKQRQAHDDDIAVFAAQSMLITSTT